MLTKPHQWNPWALLPLLAGVYWLLAAQGGLWLTLALVPATLMIAGGVSMFLWPGVDKTMQFVSAGSALGVVVAIPLLFVNREALLAAAWSAASFVVAGRMLIRQTRIVEDVPPPQDKLSLWIKAALDDMLLAYLSGTAHIPGGAAADRMCADLKSAAETLAARGQLENPAAYHRTPVAPREVRLRARRAAGHDFEELRFNSGYQPDLELPGAERHLSYKNNAEAAAWLFRRGADDAAPERPWLICIHGYRMGVHWQDFGLYRPAWLHERLRLNLMMPVLPLHGPRREGWRSGDAYLDHNFADMLHTHAQALWDIRRCIAWVRQQQPDARIGLLGFSLGGYTTALVAQYEAELDFAVACIPATDFASTLWRQVPPEHQRYYRERGVDEDFLRTVMAPVSPLSSPPLLSRDRCHIVAGVADRVVPPVEALKLAQHWQTPVHWYQGGHLSFRREPVVRETIENAMRAAGWAIPSA